MKFDPAVLEKRLTGPRNGILKIVVIDCAYDTMENVQTQTLFAKTVAMKIRGYRKHYPYGVLPADAGDFIGTHVLLCEEQIGGLEPLMGMKFTTGARCHTHHLEFPLFHVVDRRFTEHHYAVEKAVNTIIKANESFSYSASWTMDEEARKDPNFANFCKHLSIAFFYHYAETYEVKNLFAAATLRFKVEQWKLFLGYQPLENNGVPLPAIECIPFFNEPILLMHLRKFRPEASNHAEQFNYLWNRRLTLGRANVVQIKIAA